MARWRDIKQGKTSLNEAQAIETSIEDNIICASPLKRIKSFIIDMFMIMMPIMYITTYLILDGKDDLQNNDMATWITSAIYGIIVIVFWYKSGQTPGFKGYELKLIDDKTNQIPSLQKIVLRYILFLISAISIVGILLPFFRKDKKTFQDLATNTSVISIAK